MKKEILFLLLFCTSFRSLAQWATTGNHIYNTNSGRVGIGTTNPTDKFVISNNGAEGLEMGPTSGSNSGPGIQAYDRNTLTYLPIDFSASTFTFNSGNVGIGTTNPSSKFAVADGGNKKIFDYSTSSMGTGYQYGLWSNTGASMLWGIESSAAGTIFSGSSAYASVWGTNNTTSMHFSPNNVVAMTIQNGGNVGIGTTSPSERLSVNGNIRAKKVVVTQTAWSDYVFNDDYKLRPLSEVAQYIKTNKHLPETPSAKEVKEKGLSIGDNQALLLKKIEELTLYVIELKHENQKQQREINQLKKQRIK